MEGRVSGGEAGNERGASSWVLRGSNQDEWQDCGGYWLHLAEQGSREWLEVRKGRPSGSSVGSLLGHSCFESVEEAVEVIAGRREKVFSDDARRRMDHGHQFEPVAREMYEEKYGQAVTELGFVVPKFEPRIGVSVDGIVGEDGIIEIKCPQRMYRDLFMAGGKIFQSHYDQMQMGMFILDRQWCDYVVLSTSEQLFYTRRVPRDPDYWNTCYSRLQEILDTKLAPLLTGTIYPILPKKENFP